MYMHVLELVLTTHAKISHFIDVVNRDSRELGDFRVLSCVS